ncbi:MAG: hypothetical protein M1838_005408 [Thelocarpon superellum]|nr:MAG: hypothetical protein M1838_005408 [Thelocarpon superellum]
MDGLEQASEVWQKHFRITARGVRKASWVDELEQFQLPKDIDPPLEKKDFRKVIRKLEASRDIGAQLFCALLRAVGVDARLVCSLQPLPFVPEASNPPMPQRTASRVVVAERSDSEACSGPDSGGDVARVAKDSGATRAGTTGSPQHAIPRVARRLGGAGGSANDTPDLGIAHAVQEPPRRKPIRESRYPIYWVEVLSTALQKWIPVDPLVTKTIAKPSKFEPPGSDPENRMSYVIAFEEDGHARDVTRRYVKAFNAKTRKTRVEATKGGPEWWHKCLEFYSRGWSLERDQVEDTELATREAQEPMPRNVQDFKDHPIYALERHLRRHEVLHPKTEVGKVAAGKSPTNKGRKMLEPVYRRRDVKTVKSGGAWYRLGREVKIGEQPLKRAVTRRRRASCGPGQDEGDSDDASAGTALYAEFQTEAYRPPPVVGGRVPRNVYGNLDVYVPSMVPSGGVHLTDSAAKPAARLLGIDYADAVTGFEFKGRQGTAVVKGIVIATEYHEAVEAVLLGLQQERAEAEARKTSIAALRLWRRFMAALRIKKRIDGYQIEGESGEREKNAMDRPKAVDSSPMEEKKRPNRR